MISDELVQKFKALYKERFNEEISDQEALEQGIKLLGLMQVIYRPLPPENVDKEK